MWEPDFSLLGEPVMVAAPPPPLAPPLPMAPPPPRPRPALLAAPPPKRCMTESVTRGVRRGVADVVSVASVTPRVPYAQRPVVLPKPPDASRPFRHAGLMREIGGVQGFLRVVGGTHRLPEP